MSIICKTIISHLEELAPKHLAANWDNVGLLIGSETQKIDKVIVTLDVDLETIERIIDEENSKNILIVSHHPVIFPSISSIRTDETYGKMISKIFKHDISVYSMHTNLDIASGGINDILAEKLNLKNTKPLEIISSEQLYKIVCFLPKSHLNKVRDALAEAGAGHIGNYSNCTFATLGTGTFLPLENTKPYIGTQGNLESVAEYRLETIVPESFKDNAINAMLKEHPYEEVAYDVIPLKNDGKPLGLGRFGYLENPVKMVDFISQLKELLNISHVNTAGIKDLNQTIQKVAVCGGSGSNLIKKAALSGADIYVTGDLKYHDAQEAVNLGLMVIDAGHFSTENIFVPKIVDYLQKYTIDHNIELEIIENASSKNIFKFY